MPELDKLIAVAGEWVAKAEIDLKAGVYMLEMDDECPADTVGFHAQQCVEKYLKGFLVLKEIDFPKTHDILMNFSFSTVLFSRFKGSVLCVESRIYFRSVRSNHMTIRIQQHVSN